MIPSPDNVDGIALVSDSSCFRYQFFHADKHLWPDAIDDTESNFFSLHEELLGKHPAEILRKKQVLNVDSLGNQLLEKIGDPKSRIVTTFTGVYGDSGMFRHWQRLCLEGESFRQLVNDPSSYRDYLCTRQLLRVPSQTTIGESPFCMAGVIGLDTRNMLPPFMPVQRNQDGVFGKLLHLNFKQAIQGYSPWAVYHQPTHRASHVELSHALHVGPLRVSDILIALLSSLSEWPFGSDSNVNLNTTGSYLNDLSRLPAKNFKAHTLEACWKMCHKQISYLNFCLNDRPHAPEYWKKDVQQVLSNFQLLLQREDASTPCDLDGNASERLELFQELVGKFGQLLIYWPTIWEGYCYINKEFSEVVQINRQ